jgi:hypothetical protein
MPTHSAGWLFARRLIIFGNVTVAIIAVVINLSTPGPWPFLAIFLAWGLIGAATYLELSFLAMIERSRSSNRRDP